MYETKNDVKHLFTTYTKPLYVLSKQTGNLFYLSKIYYGPEKSPVLQTELIWPKKFNIYFKLYTKRQYGSS